jgi:hypothetical protein
MKVPTNTREAITAGPADTQPLVSAQQNASTADEVIAYLRHHGLVLTYDHANYTVEANNHAPVCVRF